MASSRSPTFLKVIGTSFRLLSRRERWILGGLAAARIASNSVDILAIAIVALVASLAMGNPLPEQIPTAILIADSELRIVQLLFFAVGLLVLKASAGLWLSRTTFSFLAKIEVDYSRRIVGRLFLGTVASLRKKSPAEIEWSILRSTNIAFTVLLGQTVVAVSEASLALLVVALLVLTDWQLALFTAVYISAVLALFNFFSRRVVEQAGANFSDGSVSVGQAVRDFIVAFREIRTSSAEAFFSESLNSARLRVAEANATNMFVSAIPRVLIELALIVGAAMFVAFQFVISDKIDDLAIIGIFLVGSLRLMSAVLPLQRSAMSVKFALASAESAQRILGGARGNDVSPEKHHGYSHKEQPPTDPRPSIPPRVEILDASFSFDDADRKTRAIANLTLTIAPGSFTAVIGPSGAGKSTLMDVILGLQHLKQGVVRISGLSPDDYSRAHPRSVGYVPQRPGLVSGTVAQNIAIADAGSTIDPDRLQYAIKAAGLQALVESLPQREHSDVGAHADGFSGGQLQRLGLARALYLRPKLLLLDEATSALDMETEKIVLERLEELRGTTTILLIAHRMTSIQRADTVHVMESGQITASGSWEKLSRSNSLVKRYQELAGGNSNA